VLLQFWPPQPHHKLVAGGKTLTAGETFEASDEDAAELLACPDIREAPKTSEATAKDDKKKASADNINKDTHSPERAQRPTTT
jgi:hypothetical protein